MIPAIGSTIYTLFTDPRTFADELCETISNFPQYISNFAQEIIRQVGELFLEISDFFDRQINAVIQPIADFFSDEPPKDLRNFLSFIRNEEPNSDGVRIFDILSKDDQQLHDFLNYTTRLEWFFPIETPNNFSMVPVLDRATIAALRSDTTIINRVYPVFLRVLRYYGLTINHEKNITRGPNFNERAEVWLSCPFSWQSHFRRITRIIHSLGLMLGGDNEYGRALFRIMEDIYRNEGRPFIPKETYNEWQNAVRA